MIDARKIEEIAGQCLENSDVFMVSTKVAAGNKIKILLDGENGVKIDDCAKLSRHIESLLDRDAEDFDIEVSSVGVGTPLALKRQYNINLGRNVVVTKHDQTKINGKLAEVSEDWITIEKEPVKKKKKKDSEEENNLVKLHYDEIKETKVQVSFK